MALQGTLLWAIDRTLTAMAAAACAAGSKTLMDRTAIVARQSVVTSLVEQRSRRQACAACCDPWAT